MSRETLSAGLAALGAGVLFGAGLVLSRMTDPAVVLAFLTLNEHWNPSLIGVMGSALLVTTIGYAAIERREAPLLSQNFAHPPKQPIDTALLGGAALFGCGWGLAGFCPGPAIVGAFGLDARALVFLIALLAGMALLDSLRARAASLTAAGVDG